MRISDWSSDVCSSDLPAAIPIASASASASPSIPRTATTAPRCSPPPTPACMSTSSRIATDLTDEDAMPLTAPRPLRSLILLVCAALLAACQSLPRPSGFTAEQIAVLTSEGFTAGDPYWSLSLSERLLFPFDESQVPPAPQPRIETLAHRLDRTSTHLNSS